jgi:hypothetical protein
LDFFFVEMSFATCSREAALGLPGLVAALDRR